MKIIESEEYKLYKMSELFNSNSKDYKSFIFNNNLIIKKKENFLRMITNIFLDDIIPIPKVKIYYNTKKSLVTEVEADFNLEEEKNMINEFEFILKKEIEVILK